MKKIFEHKYTILQDVYHVTPGGPQGTIVDVRYSYVSGLEYLVSFGHNDYVWTKEHELTTEKRVI